MDLKNPSELEQYSFLWSEARLVIAAVALLLGGIPVLQFLLPAPALFGLVNLVLVLTWIISGLASAYLLYRWLKHKKLFGRSEQLDTIAFFISVISGVNLGLTGLFGQNIGMAIASGRTVFTATALIYLATALYLHSRWNASGKKIF